MKLLSIHCERSLRLIFALMDDEGQIYAELVLRWDQLIALHNQGEALKIVV
jgi:hypothetical protein